METPPGQALHAGNAAEVERAAAARARSVLLCAPSLYNQVLLLELLRLLDPNGMLLRREAVYQRPGVAKPATQQGERVRACLEHLKQFKVFVSYHYATGWHTPFASGTQILEDVDAFVAQEKVCFFNSLPYSFSLEPMSRFSRIIFYLRDVRDLIPANGLINCLRQDMEPSQENIGAFMKSSGSLARHFWNGQTLAFLGLQKSLGVHVLRQESLEDDFRGEMSRLQSLLGLPATDIPAWPEFVASRDLPEVFLGQRGRDVLGAAQENESRASEEQCGWALRSAGYVVPGDWDMPPGAPEPVDVADIPYTDEKYANVLLNFYSPPARNTVVLIPARSGSSRLRNKNILPLAGMPLLAYSILLARAVPEVDRVVVSTDSEAYADVARQYGAEVPFLRPQQLSGDTSTVGAVEAHVLKSFLREEGYRVGKIVTLYPTSPFRNVKGLRSMIQALDVYPNVSTCFLVDLNWRALFYEKDDKLKPLAPELTTPTPESPYCKFAGYMSGNSFVAKGTGCKVFVLDNVLEQIDIDKEYDLRLAEIIIHKRLYNFGIDLP